MWHSLEYVCLSRIKLVLRVIKEIFHAFVQWTVLCTEMNNKWTEVQKWTNLWAEKVLYAIYFSIIFGLLPFFAVSLTQILSLFFGDVEFLLSLTAGLCKICNDNTLSYVFFLV